MKTEDEDAGQIFVEMLKEDIRKIYKHFDFNKEMIFTKEKKIDYRNATKCWICKEDFDDEKDVKVRYHCHFTGKYPGAAHSSCNLRFKIPTFTSVVFHNWANYDAHLFVINLGKTEGKIKCIPNTDEKYISFSKNIQVGSFF